MFRLTVLLAAVAFASPALSQSKPVFDFKGVRAGTVVDPAGVKDCQPDGDGNLKCRAVDAVVAGKNHIMPPAFFLRDGKLAMMLFMFDADDFSTVASAFMSKYGKPCKSETPKWQNKAGSTFENNVVSWCFATGTLKLTRLSASMKYSDATYTDDVTKLATKAVPVDF